jgi:hypothetical protein
MLRILEFVGTPCQKLALTKASEKAAFLEKSPAGPVADGDYAIHDPHAQQPSGARSSFAMGG